MKDNFERFIEAVKAGKIEGLEHWFNRDPDGFYPTTYGITILSEGLCKGFGRSEITKDYCSDHLCAHIRRWLSGKSCYYTLFPTCLSVSTEYLGEDSWDFREGSELDWHIDAVLWVLEREG